jgi:hypothetical protein
MRKTAWEGHPPSQESRLQIGDPQPEALDLGIYDGDQIVVPVS